MSTLPLFHNHQSRNIFDIVDNNYHVVVIENTLHIELNCQQSNQLEVHDNFCIFYKVDRPKKFINENI